MNLTSVEFIVLISHRKKFIYTKTAKTAGTSVEVYFEKYCLPEGEWKFAHQRDEHICQAGIIGYRGPKSTDKVWFNHMSAVAIKKKVGAGIWSDYYKFCVIRNPFDKLVSMYFFYLEKGFIKDTSGGHPIKGFRNWIDQGIPVPDRGAYMIGDKFCIDYFIRYEDLANGIKSVCDALNLTFSMVDFPHLKSGIRDHSIGLNRFYSDEIIKDVNRAYALEMKEFGYGFPDQ